jgi:HEAT repeat protein
MARVSVKQGSPAYHFSLPIRVQTAKGAKRFHPTVDQAKQELTLPVDSEPLMVEFDRDASVMAEWTVKKDLGEWVYQLEHGSTVLTRKRAAAELGKIKAKGQVAAAARALEARLANTKEYRWVRNTAAHSLGKLKQKGSARALIRTLKDKDSRVRRPAAKALAEFKGKKVTRALKRAFKNDRSYRVAATALLSYVKAGGGDPFDLIEDALDRSSHMERIRSAAVGALEEIDSTKAFNWVMKQTAWGLPKELRKKATQALGNMAADHNDRKVKALERLTELLDDKRFWVRHSAVTGLKALGDPAAIPALEKLRDRAGVRRLKRQTERAIRSLSNQKKPKADKSAERELDKLRRRTKKLEQRIKALETPAK